jgi:hypothetical protein
MAVVISVPVKLTARQEAFVISLCLGQKIAPAAVSNGWTAANGYRLVQRPDIALVIRSCAENLTRIVDKIGRIPLVDD